LISLGPLRLFCWK